MEKQKTPFVVGLTGQTGAGKTTVAKIFVEEGFVHLNADLTAREVAKREDVLNALTEVFGKEIRNEDGSLNRPILAAKAFADEHLHHVMEQIMFPPIIEAIKTQIDAYHREGKDFILLDAPTLFESGADALCDKKVAILADAALRKARIIRRDQLSVQQAEIRMNAQKNDGYYKLRCDYTLYNNGTEEQLCQDVRTLARSFVSPQKKEKRNVLFLVIATLIGILLIKFGYELVYRNFYPQEYATLVEYYAEETRIDPDLIYAVIKCESNFDANALSYADARGLMQITEDAFSWVAYRLGDDEVCYDDLWQPKENIRFGSSLLRLLLDEFQTEETALAAYHAGQGNVALWLSDSRYSEDGVTLSSIPFPTTAEYVKRVSKARSFYERLY